MRSMSEEEIQQFLSFGTRTGKLATVRADGRPHVVPIWFVLDGDNLVFTTWHDSVKAHNLRRDPQVSLCVDEEIPPYAFVVVEGTIEVSGDRHERLKWATAIASRYMGEDLAKSYGERNSVEGELVVRLSPRKILAKKDVAGW
jgi:PPOX class probable F420-dependent enzyme